MLTLLVSIALYAVSTPAPSAPTTFDEARAKAHFESFFYDYFKRDWPTDDSSVNTMAKSASRQRPPVQTEPWPIDPTRGIYCNSQARLARFTWAAVGQTTRPDAQPVQVPEVCALSEMSYHFMYGFKDHVAPDICVERPGVTGAYQGAAACYFSVMAEYFNPGFWVALREVDGKVVIAGVLEHKEALEEPEKDKRLKAFLDAIEKRFGPPPEPKPAGPGNKNKTP